MSSFSVVHLLFMKVVYCNDGVCGWIGLCLNFSDISFEVWNGE